MAKHEAMTGDELGRKLLASVRQMKAGKGTVVFTPVASARAASGLSQSEFAALLGVSLRTYQEWEQGRRSPTGAARTLLQVAIKHPEALRDIQAV